MAFDLYFAGEGGSVAMEYLLKANACRLYSQYRDRSSIRKQLDEASKIPNFSGKLFVDSGAYTAWTKDKEIDLDNYIEYLNSNQSNFNLIACLDVIPGTKGHPPTRSQIEEAAKKSWENYLYMYDRVLDRDRILPVFHIGEDFKFLDTILNHVHPDGSKITYFALGGLVGVPKESRDSWLGRVFEHISKSSNPDIKVHGFGMTELTLLEKYPFHSADSTTFIMSGAMGKIHLPSGDLLYFSEDGLGKEFWKKFPKDIMDFIDRILAQLGPGATYEALAGPSLYRKGFNVVVLKEWADNYQYKPETKKQRRLF